MKKLALLLTLFLSANAFAQLGNQVGVINNIQVTSDGDRFSILILGNGKLEPNTIMIDNPPRISLDFPNVKNALYPRTIEAAPNTYIHRIRTSLYAKGKETISRITVDLKNRWDYGLYKTKEGVVLTLASAVKKAPPKEEAKPAPSPSSSASTVPPPSVTKPNPAASSGGSEATTSPAVSRPVQQEYPPSSSMPAASQAPQDIVIGSEDLLEISVFELPQFNTTARVQGDGTITMPLVGSIEVRGLKKKDVEARIATALQAKYVNNANVSVNVKEYKSRQVSVLGEVKQPGAYYVMSQRTLLQLLSEAGGLSPAAGPKCYIFRPGAA